MSHLVEQFDLRFRVCAGLKVASAAELIASAWIDERSGIPVHWRPSAIGLPTRGASPRNGSQM